MDIKSNVTMLYGHIEKPEHIVDHLIKIRELQKKTNGFITLIPLKFSLDNTQLEKDHLVNNECSSVYDLRITALSRLMLANTLNNISVYWVAYGKKLAQVALSNGGSDLVGTAFGEEIYRAAGKPTTSSVEELATMVKEIGRAPAQRNTHFGTLKKFLIYLLFNRFHFFFHSVLVCLFLSLFLLLFLFWLFLNYELFQSSLLLLC